jgi:hypothetical protein
LLPVAAKAGRPLEGAANSPARPSSRRFPRIVASGSGAGVLRSPNATLQPRRANSQGSAAGKSGACAGAFRWRVLSDWMRISANPGETFLDRMMALVDGASCRWTIGSPGVRRRLMKRLPQSAWDVGTFRKACDGSDEGGRIGRLRNMHLKSGLERPLAILIRDQCCHCARRYRRDCG